MSEHVPEHPVYVMDCRIAVRAASEKDAMTEIAQRLKAVGRDRDCSAEIRYPRTMVPSTPLFSALEIDREAKAIAIEVSGRCGHRSDQGLTCGLAMGHKGSHNALAWAVEPPPESVT